MSGLPSLIGGAAVSSTSTAMTTMGVTAGHLATTSGGIGAVVATKGGIAAVAATAPAVLCVAIPFALVSGAIYLIASVD